MKPIMKKVSTLKGCILNSEDILDFLQDLEYYGEEGEVFTTSRSDKVTVKLKNKVIEIKDLTISFEGV